MKGNSNSFFCVILCVVEIYELIDVKNFLCKLV